MVCGLPTDRPKGQATSDFFVERGEIGALIAVTVILNAWKKYKQKVII